MNQKGQALTESLILLSICTLCSVKFIQLGLHFISQIVVEDLMEQALICKLQKKQNCTLIFGKKLNDLNYKSVQVIDHSYLNTARIEVTWQSDGSRQATLESELTFDLSVP